MQCPKCSVAMSTSTVDGLEIDVCSSCTGLWFDQDELRRSKDQADPYLSWMDFEIWKQQDRFKLSPQATTCPKCQLSMVTINYDDTNVEIEYCPQCQGTWLDQGEFTSIIDALHSDAANKSTSDYVKASLAEAKKMITGGDKLISEWRDFVTVLRMFQYRFFIEHPDLQDKVIGIQKGLQ